MQNFALPSGRGGLVAFAICLCLRAGPPPPREPKKNSQGPDSRTTKKLPPKKKKKPRTGPLHCKKKGKERGSGRIDSCIRARIRALMHCFDDKNSFLCMWNSLAFDSRARIWFFARHHYFVGLTFFVFSVDLSFRADADWSSSCTEIAGLWTHVHSFPPAAFDDWVGVAFLVLFGFFWFCLFGSLRLYVYFLSPSLATAITLSRAPAEEKNSKFQNKPFPRDFRRNWRFQTSKTNVFCKTSPKTEDPGLQNKHSLRDFQHKRRFSSKTSKFCETFSKTEIRARVLHQISKMNIFHENFAKNQTKSDMRACQAKHRAHLKTPRRTPLLYHCKNPYCGHTVWENTVSLISGKF